MKKVIILLLMCIIIVGCKSKISGTNKNDDISIKNVSIMDHDKYKNFKIDNVQSLNILRYTVAGLDEISVTDYESIKSYYNSISKVRLLKETNRACEDNTTIYEFIMNNGEKITFEFECEWLVIDNKRYEVEK